jgi:hypothetical protein
MWILQEKKLFLTCIILRFYFRRQQSKVSLNERDLIALRDRAMIQVHASQSNRSVVRL